MSVETRSRLPFCDFQGTEDTTYSIFTDEGHEAWYEYQALIDSIACTRVVYLHRDLRPICYKDENGKHEGATISLSIQQIDLSAEDSNPENSVVYDALSYVWGDASDKVVIAIDGHMKLVTRSLYTALKHIWLWTFEPRSAGISEAVGFGRPMWIDALCINQDDLDEKSQQIQRMGDIYSRAAVVYVWIEPRPNVEHDSLGQTLYFMDARQTWEYDPCPPRENGTIWMSDVDKALQLESSRFKLFEVLDSIMDGLSGDDYANLNQLVEFSEHPCWTRAWIVQELAMAKHNKAIILHGSSLAAFANLVNSIHTMNVIMYLVNYQRPWPKYESWTQVKLMQLRLAFVRLNQIESQARADPMSLAELIPRAIFRPTDATLAVDHIYSLLPLAKDFSTCGIIPDYRKSVSDVYRETMIYLLGNLGAAALTFCEICQVSKFELPSWVANFSRHGFMTLKLPHICGFWIERRLYEAGGDPATFDWKVDGRTLHISGRFIDHIACLRQMPVQDIEEESSADIWNDTTTWLRAFDDFVAHANARHGAQDADAWRVPIADKDLPAASAGEQRAPESMESAYHELLHGRPESESGVQYAKVMPVAGQTRSPFVSMSGYLGVAPRCARVSDTICAIDGADTLTILRSTEDDSGSYHIVGECYMNVFMDGQALSMGIASQEIMII